MGFARHWESLVPSEQRNEILQAQTLAFPCRRSRVEAERTGHDVHVEHPGAQVEPLQALGLVTTLMSHWG